MTRPTDVLRHNRNFRLLFIGQAISQLGDWFNSVAVFALLLDLTGSATAVAWMMIVQFLPMALIGPLAGVVVDRIDRRRLMIAADVFRGVMVLGLLLVRDREHIWLAYLVIALSVSATAFFEPARTATIPNVTSADELMPANALSSAMWSAMLAVGASIGGLVTVLSGRDWAFVINGASFFISAFFISRTDIPWTPRVAPGSRLTLADALGLNDLREGFAYVRRHTHVAALMFVKAGWGLAGGVLLLLTIFGQRVFPVAGTAGGIGVLYGARGIGAALGPMALRWLLGQEPATLRRAIGPAYFMVGLFYAVLGLAPVLPVAALAVLCAHFGGSILWVFSTVLLQMEVPDRLRGRVFSAELALVTLTSSISSYVTGVAIDTGTWSPRTMALLLGGLFFVPGTLWLLILARWVESPKLHLPTADMSAEEEELEGRIG